MEHNINVFFDRNNDMKTLKTLCAIFLVGAAFAAQPVLAQTAPAPSTNMAGTNATAKAARPARAPRYGGIVGSVDASTMTITLKANKSTATETKIKVTSATEIKKGKEAAQFSDITAGMRIGGAGKKGADGVWTATTVDIAAPKAVAPTPAPAAKE